ncbi:uncharacterized protein LOC131659483 [Vicia villosa]|uniref:uncharacterized protein LOC131659483 n=1 Tax=Vicia villosa TaxID=3911 RepID=UPI00273C58A2|nr:uncharacterized protein LOC131659483 [Vicia villosa]
MKDNKTVDEYFEGTLAIANKMFSQGEKMEKTTIVEKVLRFMTTKFNYMVYSIEELNDVSELSFDELQSRPFVHEQRMKINQENDDEQVLKIVGYNRGGVNNRGRGRGGSQRRGRGRQSKD